MTTRILAPAKSWRLYVLPSTPGSRKSGAAEPIGGVFSPGGSATAAPAGTASIRVAIPNVFMLRFIAGVSRWWRCVVQAGSLPVGERRAKSLAFQQTDTPGGRA